MKRFEEIKNAQLDRTKTLGAKLGNRKEMMVAITKWMPLIHKMANNYYALDTHEELVSVCIEAFITAINEYNPDRKRCNFVRLVEHYMKNAIRKQYHLRNSDKRSLKYAIRYIEEFDDNCKMSGRDYRSMFKEDEQIQKMIEEEQNKADVEMYLSILTPKERFAVEKYFGIGCDKMTFAMIGDITGTSKQAVHLIVKYALFKIQKKAETYEI